MLCGLTLIAVEVGDIVVEINAESGFLGIVEAGPAIRPFCVETALVVLLFVDRSVLNPGVGMAKPSLSICGVSVFVSTSLSFDSKFGVEANGECVTEIKVEVAEAASGVLTPCNIFCQSDDGVVSGLRLHAAEEGGGVGLLVSSINRLFFLFGEGMYLFNKGSYYIYMINLPDAIIRHISSYLWVKEVLNFEVGSRRPFVNRREDLLLLYHREPKRKEVKIYKKGRNVKYILDSYYEEDRLYTKVTSWYGKHKIISVVAHKKCTSTVEANIWTMNAFTLHKTSVTELDQLRHRILLKLHL